MPGPKGNMGITYTSAKGQKGIRGPIGPPGPPGTTSAEFTGNNETLIGKIVPYRIHTQLSCLPSFVHLCRFVFNFLYDR